jgi:hypothetical protein
LRTRLFNISAVMAAMNMLPLGPWVVKTRKAILWVGFGWLGAVFLKETASARGRAEAGQVGGVYQVQVNAAGPEWFRAPQHG